jgi:hypothetical protein
MFFNGISVLDCWMNILNTPEALSREPNCSKSALGTLQSPDPVRKHEGLKLRLRIDRPVRNVFSDILVVCLACDEAFGEGDALVS